MHYCCCRSIRDSGPSNSHFEEPGNRGGILGKTRGMLEAAGQWLLFSDADLSTPIVEVEKLGRQVEPILGSQLRRLGCGRPLGRDPSQIHSP